MDNQKNNLENGQGENVFQGMMGQNGINGMQGVSSQNGVDGTESMAPQQTQSGTIVMQNPGQQTQIVDKKVDSKSKVKMATIMTIVVLIVMVLGLGAWGITNAIMQNQEIDKLKNEVTALNKKKKELEEKSRGLEAEKEKWIKENPEKPAIQIKKHKEIEAVTELSVDKELNNIVASVNWDAFNKKYKKKIQKKGIEKNMTVSGFKGTPKLVFEALIGQVVGDETIFYLMDDGSVEFTPIEHSLTAYGELKSFGKLVDVKDVVRLEAINKGGFDVRAYKQDGSFYDLYAALSKTTYYK